MATLRGHNQGTHKSKYWEHYLEDLLTLVARLPEVAARIYCNVYRGGVMTPSNPDLDMAANYATMMGYGNKDFIDLMRLYLVIHSDHEGGNVRPNRGAPVLGGYRLSTGTDPVPAPIFLSRPGICTYGQVGRIRAVGSVPVVLGRAERSGWSAPWASQPGGSEVD